MTDKPRNPAQHAVELHEQAMVRVLRGEVASLSRYAAWVLHDAQSMPGRFDGEMMAAIMVARDDLIEVLRLIGDL